MHVGGKMRLIVLLVLLAILTIATCSLPCSGEIYPYPVKECGKISPLLLNYLNYSTADAELLDISPDGKNWRVDFDRQRKAFRVIGICSYQNGTFLELNEKAKNEIYAPRFNSNATEPYLKGVEVHSGHFIKDEMEVFIPFHYLIYPDGNEVEVFSNPLTIVDGILKVNQVPWAMGNWNTNCESLVIAALGDNLTSAQVEAIKKRILLLKKYRKDAEIKSRLDESQTKLFK